jgi:hypothetical protein
VEVSGVTITAGSFYVELRYTSTSSSNPYLLIDNSASDNRSYIYDGTSWSLLPYPPIANGDWAIQATVTGKGYSTLSDRVNNVAGIDISSPATGNYSIRIEGYNVPQGPQPYALLVTGGNLSVLTESVPPTAPSNLSASSESDTRINLSWADNSPTEDGFRIERKTGTGGTYSSVATVGENVTNYADTGCSEATTYSYRLIAFNADGDSMYSSEVNATTFPAAPSGLACSAVSSSAIGLSWADNSGGETGFRIERKTGTGGTYSPVATVGKNVINYTDTGLSASTTYFYRVKAYNVTGNSDQSNEAEATTFNSGGGGGGGCFIASTGWDLSPNLLMPLVAMSLLICLVWISRRKRG